MSKITNSIPEMSCGSKIIQQIEKQLRKGYVEGVLFDACLTCEGGGGLIKIAVPATHVQVYGSSVRWKSHGSGEGIKVRK